MNNQITQSQPAELCTGSLKSAHERGRDEVAEKMLTRTLEDGCSLLETCKFILIEAQHALVNLYLNLCSFGVQVGSGFIKMVRNL